MKPGIGGGVGQGGGFIKRGKQVGRYLKLRGLARLDKEDHEAPRKGKSLRLKRVNKNALNVHLELVLTEKENSFKIAPEGISRQQMTSRAWTRSMLGLPRGGESGRTELNEKLKKRAGGTEHTSKTAVPPKIELKRLAVKRAEIRCRLSTVKSPKLQCTKIGTLPDCPK